MKEIKKRLFIHHCVGWNPTRTRPMVDFHRFKKAFLGFLHALVLALLSSFLSCFTETHLTLQLLFLWQAIFRISFFFVCFTCFVLFLTCRLIKRLMSPEGLHLVDKPECNWHVIVCHVANHIFCDSVCQDKCFLTCSAGWNTVTLASPSEPRIIKPVSFVPGLHLPPVTLLTNNYQIPELVT